MRLVPTGEFSFIVAAAAGALGRGRDDLYAVFAAVFVGTILLTPVAERYAAATAARVARRMPKALVTFETLLATWYDKLRLHRDSGLGWPGLLHALAWIAVDAVLILTFVIGASSALPRLSVLLDEFLPGPISVARWLIVAVALLACVPFATGIVLQTNRLAALAAESVFPLATSPIDPAAAPRRALRVTVHAVLLGTLGLPILAVLQPFLPYSTGAFALLFALVVGAGLIWRSIANLEGHVRAGTQVVAEVLGRQARAHQPHDLEQVNRLLPGLGNLTPLRLHAGCSAVGQRLGDLDVHGRTQATIVCLSRGDDGVLAPEDDLLLSSDDVIVLAGTLEAIEGALRLLSDPAGPEP
jgi:CPA2 family monovalent cation:H+ antiporter-2